MKQYYGWYFNDWWEGEGEDGWIGPYPTREAAEAVYNAAIKSLNKDVTT